MTTLNEGCPDDRQPAANHLGLCEDAARLGGAILLQWLGKIRAKEKAPRDLVTQADLASQQAIQAFLENACPDYHFLGEEDQPSREGKPDGEVPCWIVDPLDGTTNFVHQLPNFSVSVALAQGGEVLAGSVYDPIADEMYSSIRGGGAFCNGQKISVSDCVDLTEALVAFSFPADVDRQSPSVERFLAMLEHCQALRRMGSAALNLCYVATGRLDGYWASSVQCWDVAAGVLLVREAGGEISDLDGSEFKLMAPRFVAASTSGLQRQMLAALDGRDF